MSRAARLDYIDDVHGHRMYLDDKDSLGLSVARSLEPAETELVLRTVREGWTAIDIGANIGYYTLLFARAVGPTGRVIAFEPDPSNFALLQQNVKLNNYHNVTLVNSAVWSQTTTLKLHLSEENKGDHRTYESDESRQSLEIQAVALDDYFAPLVPRVDFVKMDVQGAECHALRGMLSLLRANPKAIVVTELWPQGLEWSGTGAQEHLDLLQSLGYSFFELGNSSASLTATDVGELLAKYDNGQGDFTNVLCIPTAEGSLQVSVGR